MPSFFGVSAVPVDNGTNATSTITITPPANMVAGDLILVYAMQRAQSIADITNSGGQTFILTPNGNGSGTANVAAALFYATFTGTWTANPIFNFSTAVNTSAVMIVFRPTVFFGGWEVIQEQVVNAAAAATITVTGVTPSNPNNVTIASWHTADDNTWGTLTGTGWVKTGLAAQYRNLAGTDFSSTYAYQLQTTAVPTNNVSQTQLTLGNDATLWRRITFYEVNAAPVAASFDPFGSLGFYGI